MILASLHFSDYISLLALVVALLSFAVSFYFGFRDRVKVKAFSKFYQSKEGYGPTRMEIEIVNHGRRVAVITMFGGDLANGGWHATYLGEKGLGIHLAEHEFHKKHFGKESLLVVMPDDESEYVDLWFEDSLGRRHRVKNAKRHLRLLRESKE